MQDLADQLAWPPHGSVSFLGWLNQGPVLRIVP